MHYTIHLSNGEIKGTTIMAEIDRKGDGNLIPSSIYVDKFPSIIDYSLPIYGEHIFIKHPSFSSTFTPVLYTTLDHSYVSNITLNSLYVRDIDTLNTSLPNIQLLNNLKSFVGLSSHPLKYSDFLDKVDKFKASLFLNFNSPSENIDLFSIPLDTENKSLTYPDYKLIYRLRNKFMKSGYHSLTSSEAIDLINHLYESSNIESKKFDNLDPSHPVIVHICRDFDYLFEYISLDGDIKYISDFNYLKGSNNIEFFGVTFHLKDVDITPVLKFVDNHTLIINRFKVSFYKGDSSGIDRILEPYIGCEYGSLRFHVNLV